MLSDSRGTQLPADFLPYHIMSTARAKRYYYLSINGPLSVETIAPGERLEENHLLAFVYGHVTTPCFSQMLISSYHLRPPVP